MTNRPNAYMFPLTAALLRSAEDSPVAKRVEAITRLITGPARGVPTISGSLCARIAVGAVRDR